jgi:hypothetical protein
MKALTMTELSPMAQKIMQDAKQHGGRYLLRRRFRAPEPWDEKTDLDRQYDACSELCNNRHADWLAGSTAPGIRLRRSDVPDEVVPR